jgi:hypothetical protein
MALAVSAFRLASLSVFALSAALLLAGIAEAKPMKFGQRPSDCKTWDCQGDIICSCCFFNGCYICDGKWSETGTKPDTDSCHWEDAATTRQPAGNIPATKIPGATPQKTN